MEHPPSRTCSLSRCFDDDVGEHTRMLVQKFTVVLIGLTCFMLCMTFFPSLIQVFPFICHPSRTRF